jgi:hypothetical protein
MQAARHVFLVRPAGFGYNHETARTNSFQVKPAREQDLSERVLQEFDSFAASLRAAGVGVTVFDDTAAPRKPDAVFPNNWISLHEDGTVVLYPMCTPNRRPERRADLVDKLAQDFEIRTMVDLSVYEKQNRFLEGTGSIVFDHIHKIAYACLSRRTDKLLLEEVCEKLGYEPFGFTALDAQGAPIYHTNVMMCVGTRFAVICSGAVNKAGRAMLKDRLLGSGRELLEISMDQMGRFAGNMLELSAADGKTVIALSQNAQSSLTQAQKEMLGGHAQLLALPVPAIEQTGGGSVRCMIAEIFCRKKFPASM